MCRADFQGIFPLPRGVDSVLKVWYSSVGRIKRREVERMAVIKDVAQLANLSVSAVSKYLKSPDSVRADTRKRIEKAIKDLNYVPSAAARSLRTGLTGMITVICPNITNPFFAELFHNIQQCASQYGYTSILQTQDVPNASVLKERLVWNGSVGVDGIIVCFPDDASIVDIINSQCAGTPVVYMTWKPLCDWVSNAVLLDVEDGIYIATRHLLDCGHRRIGYIGAAGSITSAEKFKGYERAMHEAEAEITQEYIFHGPYGLDTGFQAAARFMNNATPPSAAVTESDVFAIGCLKYCLRNAIHVPETLSITGYDDVPMAVMYEPPLTTIHLPLVDMARATVDKLHCLISQHESGVAVDHGPVFHAKLVVRKTTNPAFQVLQDVSRSDAAEASAR